MSKKTIIKYRGEYFKEPGSGTTALIEEAYPFNEIELEETLERDEALVGDSYRLIEFDSEGNVINTKYKYQSTKIFDNYSVAIRQHKAIHSHCQLLHGYALKFQAIFESVEKDVDKQLDEMNWIMDYGGFKSTDATPTPGNGLKDWMNNMWDHTTLIEKDDPHLESFKFLEEMGACKLIIMDKIGAESAAKLVFDKFNERLALTGGGRVKCVRVECWETDRNSSIYMER